MKKRSPLSWLFLCVKRRYFRPRFTFVQVQVMVWITVGLLGLSAGLFLGGSDLVAGVWAEANSSFTIDTDTEFAVGSLTDTTITGTGAAAEIQLTDGNGLDNTDYSREITIDNTSNSSTLTEYQVLIDAIDTADLVTNGKLNADCSDLRFGSDSVTPLDFVVVGGTCNTTDTEIWVKVESIPANSTATIYMYYGNSSLSSVESESETFSYSTEKTVAYVLDSTVNDLQLISLEAGNSITHNSVTRNLGQYQTSSFTSIDRFSPISATKFFSADDLSNDTDAIVPVSWAGTEFMVYSRDGSAGTFHAIAPWGNATVNVYDNGTLDCSGISVTGTGTDFNCTLATGEARVTSDIPILLFFSKSSTDPMPLHPSSTDDWLGNGRTTIVIANQSGADYRYWSSNQASVQNPGNLGVNNSASLGGNSFGGSPGFRIWSTDNPIVPHQYADSDGNDGHMFKLMREMGTVHGSAVTTDYIAAVSNQPFSCTVYNTAGGGIASGSSTSSNSSVHYLGLGTGNSSTLTATPWYMICDKPVSAHYQKGTDAETTLHSHLLMRQFSHPEPSVSVASETPTLPSSGTWESADDSNVIDLIWNGGWADGTGSNPAFEATVADVSANGTIQFEMRVATSTAELSTASYQSLGSISSGTSFSVDKDTLDGLSLGTGNNRYVQIRSTHSSLDNIENPKLDTITLYYLSDDTAPDVNASNISMYKTNGGDALASNDWTNNEAPYFSWTAGSDPQSGLKGYCLYLGTDSNGNPATSKGLLGTSPVDTTGTTCQFIVDQTEIDFATTSYRGGTWLTSDTDPYYLNIRAVDNEGNVFSASSAQFQFRFDNTDPSNPAFLSLPGDFIATKSASVTWPTIGPDQAQDDDSGVAGLQYRIGSSGTWYGDSHSGTEDLTDLLANDGIYQTQEVPDFTDLVEGSNLFYLRTWDVAGNVTNTYISGALKINISAPSMPQNLSVSPTTNTTNAFAFDWDAPASFTGQETNITYCYTINTLPNAGTCMFTAAGVTELPEDAYANQPGDNTLYVVAKDEAGNINYSTFATVTFSANTSAPGIPLNLDIADVSIKASSSWRLALSWDEPDSVGAGIASYQIYRSTDNSSFSEVSTNNGTSFIDSSLDQETYYYKVRACDSANNCGAFSSVVSLFPDGKFTEAPSLTADPEVTNITTKKATILWSTSRDADSKVAYGTSSGEYFDEEPSKSDQVTDHEIQLTNLSPGTTYYFKVRWTDEDGNTGESDEFTFTTDPAPTIQEVSVTSVGINSALITFTVSGAARVKLYYGESTTFGGLQEVATNTDESTYTVQLSGLADGTQYFYKLNAIDVEGDEHDGTILDFLTFPRPRVSNIQIQQVIGTAQPTVLVSWTSNTEISSIVTYYPDNDLGASRDQVDVELIEGEHQMILKGLLPNTRYTLIVKGVDSVGNEAVSDPQSFDTSIDTRPPKIKNLQVNGTIVETSGNSDNVTAQLIVSWDTDEPASSQVEFGEGTGNVYAQRTQEDSSLNINHLVVISNLSPSKVYHLRALSNDQAGNEGKSVDTVTITPKATDSALNLIITNLRQIFGFISG